jgi:hypothetical protein
VKGCTDRPTRRKPHDLLACRSHLLEYPS